MATASDALVERVARAMFEARSPDSMVWDNETNTFKDSYRIDARAAIAVLSTPEFALPLAEEMLRGKAVYELCLSSLGTSALRGSDGKCVAIEDTLLDAYRAAKGE